MRKKLLFSIIFVLLLTLIGCSKLETNDGDKYIEVNIEFRIYNPNDTIYVIDKLPFVDDKCKECLSLSYFTLDERNQTFTYEGYSAGIIGISSTEYTFIKKNNYDEDNVYYKDSLNNSKMVNEEDITIYEITYEIMMNDKIYTYNKYFIKVTDITTIKYKLYQNN